MAYFHLIVLQSLCAAFFHKGDREKNTSLDMRKGRKSRKLCQGFLASLFWSFGAEERVFQTTITLWRVHVPPSLLSTKLSLLCCELFIVIKFLVLLLRVQWGLLLLVKPELGFEQRQKELRMALLIHEHYLQWRIFFKFYFGALVNFKGPLFHPHIVLKKLKAAIVTLEISFVLGLLPVHLFVIFILYPYIRLSSYQTRATTMLCNFECLLWVQTNIDLRVRIF